MVVSSSSSWFVVESDMYRMGRVHKGIGVMPAHRAGVSLGSDTPARSFSEMLIAQSAKTAHRFFCLQCICRALCVLEKKKVARWYLGYGINMERKEIGTGLPRVGLGVSPHQHDVGHSR